MSRVWRLLLGLLGVWVGSWLSLGLMQGDALLLLHPLQAPEWLRVTYLVVLYSGLVVLLSWLWKRYPPGPLLRSAFRDFGLATLLGWVFVGLQRGLLWAAGTGKPEWPSLDAWGSALFLALPLAAIEEVVFRGYLYGVLREEKGPRVAAGVVSLLFAVVHLFRPGDLLFKLAYGFGLMMVSLLLVLLVERAGLAAAVGMHAAWISAGILDPPGRMQPGLWAGLRGEPAAGACSWLLLLVLAGISWRLFGREQDIDHLGKMSQLPRG